VSGSPKNTLIRVAVDLLLKQAGALQGSTEDESGTLLFRESGP